MQRPSLQQQLPRLIETGTRVFIQSGGYRRTRMTDVAGALGIASGTLFQYFESKEAFFDFLLHHADDPAAATWPESLPIRTPPGTETLAFVRAEILRFRAIPALDEIAESPVGGAREEFASVVGDLYDVLLQHRRGLKLVEQSALDYPELAVMWFTEARLHILGRLENYLRKRSLTHEIGPLASIPLAARMVLETCVVWAVHRHWDPQPQAYPESEVRASVVALCLGNLLHFPPGRG